MFLYFMLYQCQGVFDDVVNVQTFDITGELTRSRVAQQLVDDRSDPVDLFDDQV